MKSTALSLLTALLFAFFSLNTSAQSCIDESSINLDIMCPMNYDPVCGCDGVTYSNACVATNHHGVTSYTSGECQPVDQECMIVPANVDFGMCAMPLGWAMIEGQTECTMVSGCGYVVNDIDYSPYFFEFQYACNGQCSEVVVIECIDSSLIDPLALCPLIWAPVCGCDGITYSNDCVATTYGGVTMWTEGECVKQPVNECFDMMDQDFGLCDMWLGYAMLNGSCQGLSGCGYVSNDIDYSPYFYATLQDCVTACDGYVHNCINPEQIDPNTGCITVYDPVCGCDNVTYSNTCVAFYTYGVTSWTAGECEGNSVDDINGGQVSVFPNPTEAIITVTSTNGGFNQVSLYDAYGKLVFVENANNRSKFNLSLEALPAGIYMIHLQKMDGTTAMRRLVKQ